MNHASTAEMPVPLSELQSNEWLHLTFGLLWRSTVWTIISSILATPVSYAIAFGLSWAMGDSPDPRTYTRLSIALTLAAALGLGFVAFRVFAQWILSARYGSLRLVVVRSAAVEHPVEAA